MKTFQQDTTNETKHPRTMRRISLLGALMLLIFGAWNSAGCLYQPLTFQAHNVEPCQQQGGAQIAAGALDVTLTNGYILRIGLLNTLATTSDPTQFRPETNYIQVNQLKIWFEYPANFSLNGGGAALYPESAPKIQKAYFRLAPTTNADFAGLQGGGAGGGVLLTPSFLITSIVPPETAEIWNSAAELKSGLENFQAIAHIVVTGTTGTGSVLNTQEIVYPITICAGCMDVQAAVNTGKRISCTVVEQPPTAGGGGGGGSGCLGQDGVCRGAPQTTP